MQFIALALLHWSVWTYLMVDQQTITFNSAAAGSSYRQLNQQQSSQQKAQSSSIIGSNYQLVPQLPALVIRKPFSRPSSQLSSSSSSLSSSNNSGGQSSSGNPTNIRITQDNKRFHQKQQSQLNKQQQQLLAANPNLLNPLPPITTNSNDTLLPSTLSSGQASGSSNLASSSLLVQQQQAQKQLDQQLDLINKSQYRGYSLFELDIKTESDLRYLEELHANLSEINSSDVSSYTDVDFWSFKHNINDQADILLSPKSRQFILDQLSLQKIKYRVKIDDIQSKLDEQLAKQPTIGNSGTIGSTLTQQQQQSNSNSTSNQQQQQQQQLLTNSNGLHELSARGDASISASSGPTSTPDYMRQAGFTNDTIFFENYQRLQEINAYLESLVDRNRDIAQVKVIGRSSQGRYLRVLKMGYDDPNDMMRPASSLSRSQTSQAAANKILDEQPKIGSIWLDGGTHAREWISPSTVLYIAHKFSDNHQRCKQYFESMKQRQQNNNSYNNYNANNINENEIPDSYASQPDTGPWMGPQAAPPVLALSVGVGPDAYDGQPTAAQGVTEQDLANSYGCDLEIEQYLKRYNFYIMPVLNPDGYEYSHTHNRLWRKTRSVSTHTLYRHFCLGADPNRNYDARHAATGSSTHPCSQTFAGTVPFTEPETRHQSNFIMANRLDMKMFITYHSYSQMILLPFSHSMQLPPDYKDLDSVGKAGAKGIEQFYGTKYKVGPSASVLYTASGTASDWAYEKANIKYSYTIELRDTGNHGFLLPRNQIIPTGEETFNGLMAMIKQMEKNENIVSVNQQQLSAKSTPDQQQQQQQSDYLSSLVASGLTASSNSNVNLPTVASSWRSQAQMLKDQQLINKRTVLESISDSPPLSSSISNAGADLAVPLARQPSVRDRPTILDLQDHHEIFGPDSVNPMHSTLLISSSQESPAPSVAANKLKQASHSDKPLSYFS